MKGDGRVNHSYLVFGVRVVSERPIPSLLPAESPFAGEPDVTIADGEVRMPEQARLLDGVTVAVVDEDCFLSIESCGSFKVSGGRRIVMEPDAQATPEQVNLYLLGTVFGVLLHQRRLLPFHCNAVEVDGSAFLFCGDSGAGKSTLAAYFVDRGFRLLSDDVCALSFADDGGLLAAPGAARLKLWEETLKLFRRDSSQLQLVPWYDSKYEMPLRGQNRSDAVPVAAIYHLSVAEERRPAGIFPLTGLQRINAVTANIYRRRFADLVGATRSYLATAASIATEIPTFTMNRNWGLEFFAEEALAAEHHMRKVAAKGFGPSGNRLHSVAFDGTART